MSKQAKVRFRRYRTVARAGMVPKKWRAGANVEML